jgi:hypothetical protein
VRRLVAVAFAAAALALPAAEAAAAQSVRLSVSPARVSTRLGDKFDFSTRVTNTGRSALDGWIAHLNVVSLTRDVYVDPEDWSAERTKYLPRLRPGASATLRWRVKAVSAGQFAVYSVLLPGRIGAPALSAPSVSPAQQVRASEHRNLNPGGALPLSLGVPALLGVALLALRARRRQPARA